jgi:hypothetical protein
MAGLQSMTPIEYEVFFALLQLKERGTSSAVLKEICQEVKKRRRQRGIQALSVQHVYYYLKRLSKRPFVKKENEKKIAHYSLVRGTWKLTQSPPLCIHIDDRHFVLICDKTATCRKEPSIECVQDLVNMGNIVLPVPA